MSKIWATILVVALLYGIVTGRGSELSQTILSLPLDAFTLTVTLITAACFWNGFMNIMRDVGFVKKLARILRPLMKLLFPHLNDSYAIECISTNIAANMLGLGFAATPSGLKGIKRLQELSPLPKDVASDEMVTFLVLNTSGVTLIPTSVIAIRQALGSHNPMDFILLGIIATVAASVVGLIVERMMRRPYL